MQQFLVRTSGCFRLSALTYHQNVLEMAEILGAASSALAVIELSTKVAILCSQYLRDVSKARETIERLHQGVADLRSITESVRELLDGPRGHRLVTAEKLRHVLEESRSRLDELLKKLSPSRARLKMSRLGVAALKWPFESKDTERAVQDLARYTQTMSLALQVDQTQVAGHSFF